MRSNYINNIKTLVKDQDLRIKKSLGQNFLVDEQVMSAMIESADLDKTDQVLEIGPGLGFLTDKILERSSRIIAIEKDKWLYRILSQKFKQDNIKFINGDVFAVNLAKHKLDDLKYKIVSNIPYYLTSKLIRYFLEYKIRPSVMVILVQKEVAHRVVAPEGKHSLLSLSVQYYGRPEIIMDVQSSSFFPSPDISSAILKIKVFNKPLFKDINVKLFFWMLKIAFSSRRKQLHNNLASGLQADSNVIKQILTDTELDPIIRAQDLSLDNWHKLYLNLRRSNLLSAN